MVIKTNSKNDTAIKSVTVRYFALLKEERGLGQETIETTAETVLDLYEELRARWGFALEAGRLRVAIKDEFVGFETKLCDQAEIIFVPPVAGG